MDRPATGIASLVLMAVGLCASASAQTAPSSPALTTPKVVVSERNQTLTVAHQSFHLLTHIQKIEGTNEETVESWELRDQKNEIVYRESYPVSFQDGRFENTLDIGADAFNTEQGSGILVHGMELPSAPNSGGWVQVFGFKYGRDKYAADPKLFAAFGPPISGVFLDVGIDADHPSRIVRGATATVMHDVLNFQVWTGNFNIVYPVLINWITGKLQPAHRCIESTSKGQVERCSYPTKVEANRQNQMTFVRLFPEPDDGFTAKHVIVQPQSKIEFLESRTPIEWSEDPKAISFGVQGDVWLKIRIDGVEGWIHSDEDFQAVGLPQAG